MSKNENENIMDKVLGFWQHLDSQERELVLNNSINMQYSQEENIHSSMNNCTGVLIVKKGLLRVYILSEDGREVTLYRIGKGDICVLSMSCVLKNITFDVYIDAEEPTEILLINPDAIERISKNIYVENFLLNEAVTRFSDVMWAMEQILFLKLDQRLAVFLLDEISRTKSNTITLTHEQISKHLGAAREAVSRMLKYFEKEGLVKVSRGEVSVINKVDLRKRLKIR